MVSKQNFRQAVTARLLDPKTFEDFDELNRIIKISLAIAGDEKAVISDRLNAVHEAREAILFKMDLRERVLNNEYGKAKQKEKPAQAVKDDLGLMMYG